MKKILILIGFIAIAYHFNAKAQDSYHVKVEKKCQREACLVSDGTQIGFYTFTDIEGNEFLKLNTDSNLEDVIHPSSTECFKGDVKEVVSILESLKGNTEASYYGNGGHMLISFLTTEIKNESLEVFFEVTGDYYPYQIVKTINKCVD